jgi:hypothetical protein
MELDLSNRNLRCLTNIKKDVKYLNCSGNNLISLDCLPRGLKRLNCENNNIKFIKNLPLELEVLQAGFNEIENIDLTRCTKLHSISLIGNRLKSIPKLPASVRVLHLNFNNIKYIGSIDCSLLELDIHNCNIDSIDSLPETLVVFKCDNNSLKRLPFLPENLKVLSCSHNIVEYLPPLPFSIKTIVCQDNKITILPNLPSSLEMLLCDYNNISHIPELPENLKEFSFKNNPAYENTGIQREYGISEEIDDTDIPTLIKKYKICQGIDKIPDNLKENAFDFINLEDVDIKTFLNESENNIILSIGKSNYACNRDELFTYLNTPGVRFIFNKSIFFKLPWNQVIYYSSASLLNILDYKVYEILPTTLSVRMNNTEMAFYTFEPKKIIEYFDI